MSRVGETGVGETGIGETGVGEMGVGETGPNRLTRPSVRWSDLTKNLFKPTIAGDVTSFTQNQAPRL